ncbi:hypothetical protein C2G38_2248746 [Gigaspora rosea]|uniref:Uncharacterized protein n=1 Tax=Gigaspora rosea TaxID=44941 RepID=A0A397UUY5_9GLOM|nr:hypothetical protein C2G38_2248746 [Gigaspora rosea]
MLTLVTKIKSFLLEAPLEAICGASIFYLTMDGEKLGEYDTIKTLTNCAVTSVLPKIKDHVRKAKVLKILPQVSFISNMITIFELINDEISYNKYYTREEINQSLRTLKSNLKYPMTDTGASLYNAFRINLNDFVDASKLTWKDPIASTVLNDDSKVVEKLSKRQRRTFLFRNGFINNFKKESIPDNFRNIRHDGLWKGGDVWNNPAFKTSMSRNMQSEGTYVRISTKRDDDDKNYGESCWMEVFI